MYCDSKLPPGQVETML
ncbi:unnamed protein product, partial [Rotaria magnacalcarata]